MLKILLIDDHGLFREGLTHLIANLDDDVELLQTSDCEEAFALISELPELELTLDLILLDLSLPGMSGLQGMQQLQTLFKTVPIVIVSAAEDKSVIKQVFKQGAQGFIPKSASSDIMIAALKIVLAGGIYAPYDFLSSGSPRVPAGINALSERQRQVLALLAQGYSNKRIARQLDISDNTVRVHVSSILRILGADNRTEAAKMIRDIPFTDGNLPEIGGM